MTDDRTPLQRLDDAVHAFAREIGDDGTVGAWVLAYETTRIVDEPDVVPLVHGTHYALGPAAGAAVAHGLASAIADLCRQQMVSSMQPGDETE